MGKRVQGPLWLKLLFVGLKTISPSATAYHPAHCNIHCVPLNVSIMSWYHFSICNENIPWPTNEEVVFQHHVFPLICSESLEHLPGILRESVPGWYRRHDRFHEGDTLEYKIVQISCMTKSIKVQELIQISPPPFKQSTVTTSEVLVLSSSHEPQRKFPLRKIIRPWTWLCVVTSVGSKY